MKHPVILSSLVFALSLGCSDESGFMESGGKRLLNSGNKTIPNDPNATPPGADAKPETDESGDPTIGAENDPNGDGSGSDEEESEGKLGENVGKNPPLSEEVKNEDVVASLPNAEIVTKVGVNFEDRPGTDADYNDAVLCFKGGFEVTSSIIQSTMDQTVEAALYSDAECNNSIKVNITRNGQLISTTTYNPKQQHKANLKFLKGDRLEVSMVSLDCDAGAVYSMTDKRYTELSPNVCNDR